MLALCPLALLPSCTLLFTSGSGPDSGPPADSMTPDAGADGSVTETFLISASSDDVEEAALDGDMSIGSSDLELGFDGDVLQIVGLRYTSVTIARNAAIQSASIQFTVDSTTEDDVTLTIHIQDTADGLTFTDDDGNLSSRALNSDGVEWIPAPWLEDEAGAAQQSPDLAVLLQELVNRDDWVSGYSAVFVISAEGAGSRSAQAFDEDGVPPVLNVTFTPP